MFEKDLTEYETLVFDCDGVVLNSNMIKTEAFYSVAKSYGHEAAQLLKNYHIQNGGISRYIKFKYFLTNILGKSIEKLELQQLLDRFSSEVKKELLCCEVAEDLVELREKTKQANWLIVSGGDQAELREIFAARKLAKLFDGGIYGSPDNKGLILDREINNKNIKNSALFLGDSKYDYQAAIEANLDFVFLKQWTEVKNYQDWCDENNIIVFNQLNSIP